ncbi:MAG: stage III sporulation protein AD [Mahellales bacterium]|jgi:stage III sporulation protein AD
MEIFQIVAIGIIAVILIITIKGHRPEISMQISIAAGVIIFLLVVGKLASVIELLRQMVDRVNMHQGFFSTILKIIGIAYIAEFGVQLCKDAGENAIASKIEFAGKILIMVLAVPIVITLLDLIINLME